MIVDLERGEGLPDFAADVCIVGAGAAGIVLAAELVRQGRRVQLLESGGAETEAAVQALNACVYVGQPHQGANIGRFRALGGTTTVWGGQVLELNEEDFAARPWIPGSGWPFSKDDLRAYYSRAFDAEHLSQAAGTDAEVWRQMNQAPPEMGDSLIPYFTRWCPEPNFARLYRETLASPNLCVVLHATATAMLLDGDSSRIRGIRCTALAGQERTFCAARYVLCLGTIESVRFLMQPLPGIQTSPWDQSRLLGRHFQSHIDYNAARVSADDAGRLRRWFANAYLHGYKYHPKFRLAPAVQQEEQILSIAGSITCINPAEQELRRVKLLARNLVRRRGSETKWKDLPGVLRQLPTMVRLAYGYRLQHRAYWPKESRFWLRVHCEQEPLSQSRITLLDDRDAVGMFFARLDWRVSGLEWKTIRSFTRRVQRSFAALGEASVAMQPELELEEGFRDVTFDNSHHHMGGARMSEDSTEGVVDSNLRLHGVENAYVCSAAVFPSAGFSNPTHTLLALAIRLADHLTTRSPEGDLSTAISTSAVRPIPSQVRADA